MGVHVGGDGEVGVSDVALWSDLAYHRGKAGVLRIGDVVQDHGHHDGLAGASVSQIRVSIAPRLAEQQAPPLEFFWVCPVLQQSRLVMLLTPG